MREFFSPSQTMRNEYVSIHTFVEEYADISYLQLDNYTTQKINLFALPESERFRSMEALLDKIISCLPALKRIFSKPITRLNDVVSILPVEAVRVINSGTIRHIAVHTELWGNVTQEGLKPRKLMTLTHEDDYKIYENIAFTRLIDYILAFVRDNIRLLQDIMYSCQPMHFNLLERTNHLMHFLAIGKLHVGYAHSQDSHHDSHKKCLEKLMFLDSTIRSKLNSPIYKACKKDHSKITLKKSNIFRLQKDYKQVYNLLKLFMSKDTLEIDDGDAPIFPERGYADFCSILSVFALGHFNFQFDEKQKFNFSKLKVSCNFNKWNLKIDRITLGGIYGLRFRMNKDLPYTVCLIFYQDKQFTNAKYEAFKTKYPADEYIYAEPNNFGEKDKIYLSLYDISSFRRIQQFILRAMIYSDTKKDTCPFCGAKLVLGEEGHECDLCKTLITERVCPETQKPYFTTTLSGYKFNSEHSLEMPTSKLFTAKEIEGLMFYRNITPLSPKGYLLCPQCNKQHKFKK